jgi:glycerophosphoryl diester phosphodiesterase
MNRLFIILTAVLITSCSKPQTAPMIVAHRGASHDAPENTIPAFLLAWEQGSDAIEGDFFLTADREVVCIHDSHTGRVSDTNLIVAESSLEELRKLDAGSWKGEEWTGTGIPTLAEVFSIVPAYRKIFVEIKPGTEILPKLYEEIDRSGLRDEQIVIISFNADVVREFKTARPEHKAYWLSGLRKDDHGNVVPGLETVLETLERTGADGFSSHHGLVTGEFVDQILNAGYEYHVWTVNDPARAWELKGYGAMSITTDVPGLIREYFDEQLALSRK